jgi:hypothetical protein
MTTRRSASLLVVALLLVACAGAGSPSPSGVPIPSPSPSGSPPPGPLSLPELEYRLIDAIGGRPWFCDPDVYPVSHGDEPTNAQAHFAEIRADAPTFAAITRRLGFDPAGQFAVEGQVLVYREWKMLTHVFLEPAADAYRFDLLVQPPAGTQMGTRYTGTISKDGSVTIATQAPAGEPPCPICLARGTRIATPDGPVAVERLRPGMSVWTLDGAGRRVAGIVLEVGSAAVPVTHLVVHLVLADGRTVTASPGHPLPDGRRVGDLRPGDLVDGARVVSADLLPYGEPSTFDLLPSGPTGVYWADGIPLASTLRR